MSFFDSFTQNFLNSMEKRAAIRVFDHLQLVDSAALVRAGISLELLAQGPSAYPWREGLQVKADAPVNQTPLSDKAAIRHAIAELKSLSNAELHDLGIARGDIPEVVRFGRPGIEQVAANSDQQAAA